MDYSKLLLTKPNHKKMTYLRKYSAQLLTISAIIFLIPVLIADPPDPGGGPGGDPMGGAAPIGNGLYILFVAGFAYLLYHIQKMLHHTIDTKK